MNYVMGEYGVIATPELRQGDKSEYLYLKLAESYQKKEGDSYVDAGTFYVTAVASGHIARMINEAKLAPGTRVVVYGQTVATIQKGYVKDGVSYPDRSEKQIRIDRIGISLSGNQTANAIKIQNGNSNNSYQATSQTPPPQNTQQTPPPVVTEAPSTPTSDVEAEFMKYFES